ncbi:phospho-sugar mutase [Sneathia sanguinegens]|uniref:Phospho-sugar mutase n=1 Tax=Sneathia sanguinegens TaxID=40543 RepID=A0ABT7HLD0_9FUSO|nr:phospho-sugar mutase [Sneathia sanguinegens]MDK9580989.1 phospho-sugar mutase [Sneathia sanguinegens]
MLYKKWLESEYIDEEDKKTILKMSKEELEENFCKYISFGTGGIRAKMGLGTNKLNKYIIRRASQGLANYLTKRYKTNISVVIARDCRINSELFQNETAKVLSSNGIKVYIYDGVRSTPEMTYAIRKLKTKAGIAITASHNTKEYNGYKVYLEDGGQVVPPYVNEIIDEINKVELKDIKYENTELVEVLDKSIDEAFIEDIKKLSIKQGNVNIVYTPLHGTAGKPVSSILEKMGYNVKKVDTQFEPDGQFPTVKSPNPEYKEAFDEAIKYVDNNTDIIIGNDPDSDRIGVVIPNKGEYIYLTGNEIGMLVLDYILKTRDTSKRNVVATTIVSTPMVDNVKGIHVKKTLTGFKYIGEIIKNSEEDYLFGFEESFGFLYGTTTRDKDGVSATMMVAEMAAYYKKNGSNLIEQLKNIQNKYGNYREERINLTIEGEKGKEQIKKIMEEFRKLDIRKIDYKNDDTGLPKSNVLQFDYNDKTRVLIRPSGTEPKLKVYIYAIGEERAKEYKEEIKRFIDTH